MCALRRDIPSVAHPSAGRSRSSGDAPEQRAEKAIVPEHPFLDGTTYLPYVPSSALGGSDPRSDQSIQQYRTYFVPPIPSDTSQQISSLKCNPHPCAVWLAFHWEKLRHLHGEHHIACHFELAGHKSFHRILLALCNGSPGFPTGRKS